MSVIYGMGICVLCIHVCELSICFNYCVCCVGDGGCRQEVRID